MGGIAPVMEYQSLEDKARNRPVRPRVDEVTGLPVFRGMFLDPGAERDREKTVAVEFTARVQPVPPPVTPGSPVCAVELVGMTVQPRAEASGQAKWITWVVRAEDLRAPAGTAVGEGKSAGRSAAGAAGKAA